ncbi:MAG: helix-turn-helix domain-containing protein [Candidatus Bathyarchaeia archaeon]
MTSSVIVNQTWELSEYLVRYGLSKRQAITYLGLLQLGAAPVKPIAEATGIPREELYRILKRLKTLGVVKENLSHPRIYHCIQPTELLNLLVKKEEERIKELRNNRQQIISKLNELKDNWIDKNNKENQPDMRIELIEGREATWSQLAWLIKHSKSSLAIVISPEILDKLLSDLLPLVRNARRRGVDVKILTEVKEKHLDSIQTISRFCPVKHLDQMTPSLLIITDNSDVASAMNIAREPLSNLDKLVVCRENVLFGCTMDLFNEMWKSATNAEVKLKEILAGEAPCVIKAGYGWEFIGDKTIGIVKNATRYIAIITSTSKGLLRLEKVVMDDLVKAKFERSVEIRILTQRDEENAEVSRKLLKIAEVRAIPPQYMYMYIKDLDEAIIGEIVHDTYDNATATGNTTWIRSDAVVTMLHRSFEALWEKAKPIDDT